jgi:pimeloyl-ACP methyl ester carboxylesterase
MIVAVAAAWGERPALVRLGGDPAPGLLVNVSTGARPFDPPSPQRPSVVFIHGVNPLPRLARFTIAERLAEAHASRSGPPVNVLAWDWNAATLPGLRVRDNQASHVEQGRRLAAALAAAGLAPESTHLIGHSSGAIVAASAARAVRDGGGRAVARVTLLDPAVLYHDLVFDRLAVGDASPHVENVWADGPGGFGRHVDRRGVVNRRTPIDAPPSGAVVLTRSAHWRLVHWYLDAVSDPRSPSGFSVGASPARR